VYWSVVLRGLSPDTWQSTGAGMQTRAVENWNMTWRPPAPRSSFSSLSCPVVAAASVSHTKLMV